MIRIFILLLLPLFLFALDAKVHIEIDKSQEFFVSKKINLVLKIMSTGFQVSDLEVDYKENKDFVIMAPQSASYNETQGDYSVVVYEYELYPLKSKKVELKPWRISFNVSLGYGMPQKHFDIETKKKFLTINSIKGYDFLLATSKLEVSTTYSSKKDTFKLGEALEREIKITAVDVPDLLIPSIASLKLEGIQTYEDEVRLFQKKNNSNLLSTRIQKETYVFESGGDYTFLDKTLHWYNTQTNKVEKVEIKGKDFSVIAPPLVQKEVEKSRPLNLSYILYIIGFLLTTYISYILYKKQKIKVKKRVNSLLVKSINPGKK